MTLHRAGWLAAVGSLVVLSVACDDGGADAGGGAGTSGSGGAGAGEAVPTIPGLWEGNANGVSVCFYVSEDGSRLTRSSECNVTGQPGAESSSYDIGVDLVGTDENGDSCSFDFAFAADVPIDQPTNSFKASGFEASGTGAKLSFSGELTGTTSSGIARMESDGSFCQVGWGASRVTPCDAAAVQSCLDLQDCCRAILVNPVFFESCNSVVLQCDQAQCLRVLAGYPQCAPEPEPELPEGDAGTPDAG